MLQPLPGVYIKGRADVPIQGELKRNKTGSSPLRLQVPVRAAKQPCGSGLVGRFMLACF